MNNPFHYTPHPLCVEASKEVIRDIESRPEWREEVSRGKMFGVLVYADGESSWKYLKAYSGQILGRSDWEGYVPAVFDYLQEDGYFKTHEADIVDINNEIERLKSSPELSEARFRYEKACQESVAKIDAYKAVMAQSKKERERQRIDGTADEAALVRESQFQKAELRRIRQRCEEREMKAKAEIDVITDAIRHLQDRRHHDSEALQQWLFEHFVMLNVLGDSSNLMEIFGDWAREKHTQCSIPPAGAGECCGPKLLQYAFKQRLRPIAMAEFWYGESPRGEIRRHGQFYPACTGKCGPILNYMLRGMDYPPSPMEQQDEHTEIEVLFEDEHMIVINKPSGMLSVPGRAERTSAVEIMKKQRNDCSQLVAVHRLDMDTSGVLVMAKTPADYVSLQKLFAHHDGVGKTYLAIVDGILPHECGAKGEISLPLMPDYINRPCQKVDYEKGKPSLTRYEVMAKKDGHTLLKLEPVTGRTHQLRVHCAHHAGLSTPILGDNLYGTPSDRLYLHAWKLTIGSVRIEAPLPDEFLRMFPEITS